MDDKDFVWSSDLVMKMFKLRFQNEELFSKKKQPWLQFHEILKQHGFPEEITVERVRKKWGYHFDLYRNAKRKNQQGGKYFKLFDKYFGKAKGLDKYASWPDEWRLKLAITIIETMVHKMNSRTMWRTIETAMRSQDLPDDCYIQDIKTMWQHIKTTFTRKYRIAQRYYGKDLSKWPLYDTMLDYYQKFEPEHLINLEVEGKDGTIVEKGNGRRARLREDDENSDENEFTWSKDLTESFIQIRLQNDWLFRERHQPWRDFTRILREEYGFPDYLSTKCIAKKWSSTYAVYQKAKATNNTSWLYYNIFELYLGEGSLTLNPLTEWDEQWVSNLINARTSLESEFLNNDKRIRCNGWREVEKRLRVLGLPLTHSLLDLPEIWSYLRKTYKWKHKFAIKGTLTEHWPFYDAMANYEDMISKLKRKEEKVDLDYDMGNDVDDFEDDMKLVDLKQKLEETKPKAGYEVQCRACANEASTESLINYVDIFESKADDGTDLASKLKVVADVEVDKSDNLSSLICYSCIKELDIAYKFRKKCRSTDLKLRESLAEKMNNIKIEYDGENLFDDNIGNEDDTIQADTDKKKNDIKLEPDNVVRKQRKQRKIKRKLKARYEYTKVCEICGKNTQNLQSHMDTHNNAKPYSCEVCSKTFKFKSGLIIHKAKHEDKPKKTCDVCGKTFYVLAHFRRHYAYHQNERKFGCETCGKRFNSMDILRVHHRTHTDERPFPCPECGKTFRTGGCVSRHRRIVHKVVRKTQ